MSKLWVKFKSNKATKVSTKGCEDVDDFLKACKKELSSKLGTYDVDDLSLSTTDGGAALRPGTSLTLIPANTDDCPLFISIVPTVLLPSKAPQTSSTKQRQYEGQRDQNQGIALKLTTGTAAPQGIVVGLGETEDYNDMLNVAAPPSPKNSSGLSTASVPEMKIDFRTFASQVEVPMTANNLLIWLCGSNTNSVTDLTDHKRFPQEPINSTNSILFPLAGREQSLEHIASCFSTSYRNRFNQDRNSRPIPVCTGIPGLGKTRLMQECASTVLDMTLIPGIRKSGIVSFGNDGNSYGRFDDLLGIQCSFAWRVLHMFFKAHYRFEYWMREKSPKNRREMSLDLALSVIEQHWSQVTEENILVFIGIDEYQKLGQYKLNSLLDILCDVSYRSTDSKLSFFCMLAGTDLNMTRIARTSHPNTERTPIRFLTHMESIKAIGPFISKTHDGFVVSEAFSQNVFYLGGVPRLLTAFAKKVVSLKRFDLIEDCLQEVRKSVLSNLQYPQLSLSDVLKVLAISFTNTPVINIQACPFLKSSQPAAREITWSQMIANGICLLQDDNRVLVPFHLVPQALERQLTESHHLDQGELALLSSLKALSFDIEVSVSNVPSWLSWEAFGANFYCIRINSFIVLGVSVLPLSCLLRGSKFRSDIFNVSVDIRVAKVFASNEHYGPDIPRIITQKNASYISVDWLQDKTLQVVLNGDNGAGVDIFFILKRADGLGHILVLDQRKRLSSHVTDAQFTAFRSKLPDSPSFLTVFNLEIVFGLMSVYSKIAIEPVPDFAYYVAAQDSLTYHGSLFDHPGCSITIDVNSSLKIAVAQLFRGSKRKRMEFADKVISQRKTTRIENMNELLSLVSRLSGELDESAYSRIRF
jgi:hypothetical protein